MFTSLSMKSIEIIFTILLYGGITTFPLSRELLNSARGARDAAYQQYLDDQKEAIKMTQTQKLEQNENDEQGNKEQRLQFLDSQIVEERRKSSCKYISQF